MWKKISFLNFMILRNQSNGDLQFPVFSDCV